MTHELIYLEAGGRRVPFAVSHSEWTMFPGDTTAHHSFTRSKDKRFLALNLEHGQKVKVSWGYWATEKEQSLLCDLSYDGDRIELKGKKALHEGETQ